MIRHRRAADRGRTDHEWFESVHSFSFGNYRDPEWTRFRGLRVLNEDRVSPGTRLGAHPHQEMEILTFVLEGALAHADDADHESLVRAGEAQRMSAGTGIVHSEENVSLEETVRFVQAWIEPDVSGEPDYEQHRLPPGFGLVAAPDPPPHCMGLRADARVHAGWLDADSQREISLVGEYAWVQLTDGAARVGDLDLAPGDGAALSQVRSVSLRARERSFALLFDLK